MLNHALGFFDLGALMALGRKVGAIGSLARCNVGRAGEI
jgi:hypothetical protein